MTATEPPSVRPGAASDAPPRPTGPSIGYLPALDGLRGLAALGIVAFHARLSWMPGGFLAVTTFFALSGFLLTSLLLAEHRRDGSIDARAFWARRFRRLLPAALATLGAVAVLAPWLATPEQLADLRGDVLAALAYVANWRLVAEGRAYTDLFAAPSPLQHFWTLSVEEQFFLVLPLVVLGVGAWTARRPGPTGPGRPGAQDYFRRRLGLVLVVAGAASAAWLWLAHDPATGSLAGYYGTGTRAAEFLVGCLAAVVLGRPDAALPSAVRRALPVVGPLALAALLVTWATTTDGSAWLYHLGFPAVALLSAVVLVAALVPGPLRTVLATAPLREVGRRSYGIYLFHWSVFVWLTEDRVGLSGTALLVVQLAVVAGLSIASFRWLEQPIRTRQRVVTRRHVLLVTPAAVVAVALAAVLATLDPPRAELVFDRIEDPVPPPVATPTGPIDVLVVGDSMANNLAQGLARDEDRPFVLWDRTTPGCGVAESERLVSTGGWQEPDPKCQPSWRDRWAEAVATVDPDVVVLLVGTQEIWDRRVGSGTIPFDEPVGTATARAELGDAVGILAAGGARVVLVTLPASAWENWGLVLADPERSVNNPEWVGRWNRVVRDVARSHPDTVVLADLAELLTPEGTFTPDRDGTTVRAADGLHLSLEGQDLAAGWLTDLLVAELDLEPPPDAVIEPSPPAGP